MNDDESSSASAIATCPPAEVVARVDQLVAALDEQTIDEPYAPPATSSYSIIASAWRDYKARIDAIDVAVADPFAAGAIEALFSAADLIHPSAEKLVFWLVHVAEALELPSAGR